MARPPAAAADQGRFTLSIKIVDWVFSRNGAEIMESGIAFTILPSIGTFLAEPPLFPPLLSINQEIEMKLVTNSRFLPQTASLVVQAFTTKEKSEDGNTVPKETGGGFVAMHDVWNAKGKAIHVTLFDGGDDSIFGFSHKSIGTASLVVEISNSNIAATSSGAQKILTDAEDATPRNGQASMSREAGGVLFKYIEGSVSRIATPVCNKNGVSFDLRIAMLLGSQWARSENTMLSIMNQVATDLNTKLNAIVETIKRLVDPSRGGGGTARQDLVDSLVPVAFLARFLTFTAHGLPYSIDSFAGKIADRYTLHPRASGDCEDMAFLIFWSFQQLQKYSGANEKIAALAALAKMFRVMIVTMAVSTPALNEKFGAQPSARQPDATEGKCEPPMLQIRGVVKDVKEWAHKDDNIMCHIAAMLVPKPLDRIFQKREIEPGAFPDWLFYQRAVALEGTGPLADATSGINPSIYTADIAEAEQKIKKSSLAPLIRLSKIFFRRQPKNLGDLPYSQQLQRSIRTQHASFYRYLVSAISLDKNGKPVKFFAGLDSCPKEGLAHSLAKNATEWPPLSQARRPPPQVTTDSLVIGVPVSYIFTLRAVDAESMGGCFPTMHRLRDLDADDFYKAYLAALLTTEAYPPVTIEGATDAQQDPLPVEKNQTYISAVAISENIDEQEFQAEFKKAFPTGTIRITDRHNAKGQLPSKLIQFVV